MSENCYTVHSLNNNHTIDYSSSTNESHSPIGDLFDNDDNDTDVNRLISKSASIRRTFGPSSNAQAMLTLGGPSLAANASFDPHYHRAREWIHHHAVGPTVQSPVLIQGLIGALVEATFPSSIIISNSMQNIRPLIVGVRTNCLSRKRFKILFFLTHYSLGTLKKIANFFQITFFHICLNL